MSDMERWREEFPILARSVYLISNSLGVDFAVGGCLKASVRMTHASSHSSTNTASPPRCRAIPVPSPHGGVSVPGAPLVSRTLNARDFIGDYRDRI